MMASSRGRFDAAPFGLLWRLTRRANQAHIDIVAGIIEPAPRERQRVFFFLRQCMQNRFQSAQLILLHFN
jgi:hypothetical protein